MATILRMVLPGVMMTWLLMTRPFGWPKVLHFGMPPYPTHSPTEHDLLDLVVPSARDCLDLVSVDGEGSLDCCDSYHVVGLWHHVCADPDPQLHPLAGARGVFKISLQSIR